MHTSTFLSEGARQVLRFKRLIVLFYLANLTAAAIVVLPLAVFITGRIGRSLESDRMFPNFDPGWVTEVFFNYKGEPLSTIGITAAIVAGTFLVVNTFLSGGALAVFHREDDTFFGACARFFLRFLRLLLLSLVIYAVILAISSGLGAAIGKMREGSMEARPWIILGWVRMAIVFVLFGTVNMLVDYAKIICVVENRRSAFKAILAAFSYVLRNPKRSLAIYWICSLIGLLFLLAYHGASELIGQGTMGAVFILLAVRQSFMLTRMWTRLWTWSSEVRFYNAACPRPVAAPVIEPEPPLEEFAGDQTLSSTMVAPVPPSFGAAE